MADPFDRSRAPSQTGDLPRTGDLGRRTGDLPRTGDIKTSDLVLKTDDLTKRGKFTDLRSSDVAAWLLKLSKAAKAYGLYSAENRAFLSHLDNAHRGLTELLVAMPELTLSVREDRFVYNGDVVYEPHAIHGSLTAAFYRNAFRRITFHRGFASSELLELLRALFTDTTAREFVEEDLVSILWRLDLPHLRYLTIDIMAIDPKVASSESEREELERIQRDLESILAALYKTDAHDDDVVQTA